MLLSRLGTVAGALALTLATAGCGSPLLFLQGEVPESPAANAAPWPKLIDVPRAPPVGTYTEAVPDPARGVAADATLRPVARDAAQRAAVLGQPVLSEAERRRLGQGG